MREFLIVYSFASPRGFGPGRTFGNAERVTQETILRWEQMICEANGYSSVLVTGYQELEK